MLYAEAHNKPVCIPGK